MEKRVLEPQERLLEIVRFLDESQASALLKLVESFQISPRPDYIIDARTACRKATGWLVDRVGNMVMGNQPRLSDDGQIWHVGAFVTSPRHEPYGPIGWIEVDARTGKVLSGAQTIEQLIEHGTNLERSLFTPGD